MADKPYFLHLKKEINLGEDLKLMIPLPVKGKIRNFQIINDAIKFKIKKEKSETIIDIECSNTGTLTFPIIEPKVPTTLPANYSDFFRKIGNVCLDNGKLSISFEEAQEIGEYSIEVELKFEGLKKTEEIAPVKFKVINEIPSIAQPEQAKIQKVSLIEPGRVNTKDQYLWTYIRNGVLDFNEYKTFLDELFNVSVTESKIRTGKLYRLPLNQTDAYAVQKFATDFYLKQYFKLNSKEEDFFENTTVEDFESESRRTNIDSMYLETKINEDNYWLNGQSYLPYFKSVLERIKPFKSREIPKYKDGDFRIAKLQDINLLELIWSYWHEEGGLVQTMNAISLRFQNVRTGGNDPMAGLNIDPLRPINNLVWGYIEDERNRLSMARRNLEYQYEYGISLIGRAVPVVQVAESRSQFLPAFHNLLKTSIDFYQQANYTTVIPDGFPVLNSLREVHMLLAEGAHNQFGSLPWTARSEMMMQQWLLARPEMREFLGGRIMVPYQEPWMDRVDTMKTIQGWNPTNVSHFHDLGKFGEQLLLSIRYGDWNNSTKTRDEAANWAYYWREEIQRYVHAYKAATGVDLGNDVTDARIAMPQNVERYTQPSVLIGRRVNSLPNNRPNQLNRLTQRRNSERY